MQTPPAVRVYGKRGSPQAYAIRDFLQRSDVPFEWVELGSNEQARDELGLENLDDSRLPICIFSDGARMERPTVRQITEKLGWFRNPSLSEYDVAIYGAGPAGLSASVYAASEGLKTVLVERFAVGGQAGTFLSDDNRRAIASFSILGDMVKQVGGDRVDVVTLVGPDGDAHVYEPTPADAKNLASSQLLFVNGLGFEGWMDRLEKSSGFNGKTIVASTGVQPRTMVEEEGGTPETITDPHAWQDLGNGKLYVINIRDGLIAADPAGKAVYEANASKYLGEIMQEDDAVKGALAKLPKDRRKIITSHDAFGYFGAAYGLEVIAPEGVSTESEASAQDVAKIIRQIKSEHIPAVFMENITDHRLLDQIARETDAKIGGELYTDALSGPEGPAPTYLDMFRHNVETLSAALSA